MPGILPSHQTPQALLHALPPPPPPRRAPAYSKHALLYWVASKYQGEKTRQRGGNPELVIELTVSSTLNPSFPGLQNAIPPPRFLLASPLCFFSAFWVDAPHHLDRQALEAPGLVLRAFLYPHTHSLDDPIHSHGFKCLYAKDSFYLQPGLFPEL